MAVDWRQHEKVLIDVLVGDGRRARWDAGRRLGTSLVEFGRADKREHLVGRLLFKVGLTEEQCRS